MTGPGAAWVPGARVAAWQVYHPCVLQTKKRYVGDKYESLAQPHPELDAKGIELVRRDTCPLVSKTLEACICALFRRKDLRWGDGRRRPTNRPARLSHWLRWGADGRSRWC